jgi:hypothetical protein
MGAAAMDQASAAHENARASQTGADAQMVGQLGQAALHHAQAGMVSPLGESEIGLQGAQGGYYGAQSNLANQNAAQVAPLAGSEIDLRRMQGDYYGAQIRQYDQGSGNFATGTSRVSAPGDGTVDTTKARLANGEAVLNKGAAEHLGQPAIQALNAVGMLRMGMVPGQNTQAPQASGPGYAKGTSKAGPKKAAKTDDKSTPKADKSGGGKPSDTPSLDQIDPKMLATAMQMGMMGQQGGGMPPVGQPQAPQQMPQGAPMGMM